MANVLCLGEILVDWVCTTKGAALAKAELFTKAPGGAPANTAVSLARQGIKTAFLGRLARDHFGAWLRDVLIENGIDISGMVEDPDAQTRMAYVVTDSHGDRILAGFTKIAAADTRLKPSDLNSNMFSKASILHFGSISLIDYPAAAATRKAIKLARDHNMLVSYDPNIRIGLWENPEACRTKVLNTVGWADIVKINEDELKFLTGSNSLKNAKVFYQQNKLALLLITLGHRGALIVNSSGTRMVSGFKIRLKDPTGAGDGFNAGIIAGLVKRITNTEKQFGKVINRRRMIESLTLDELATIVKRANAIGALTCTKVGAIPALPTSREIEAFLKKS